MNAKNIKIIAGWCQGLALKSPKQSHTRPTSSRVREAVWSAIYSRLQPKSMIDFFSGTGAMGIEGLSRGVGDCLFVENFPQTLTVLRHNLKELQNRARRQAIQVSCDVWPITAEAALKKLQTTPREVDLVWMDPPYSMVVDLVASCQSDIARLVGEAGYWVVESDKKDADEIRRLVEDSPYFEIDKQASYGSTVISYMKRIAATEEPENA